jgi:hypothetical protein
VACGGQEHVKVHEEDKQETKTNGMRRDKHSGRELRKFRRTRSASRGSTIELTHINDV